MCFLWLVLIFGGSLYFFVFIIAPLFGWLIANIIYFPRRFFILRAIKKDLNERPEYYFEQMVKKMTVFEQAYCLLGKTPEERVARTMAVIEQSDILKEIMNEEYEKRFLGEVNESDI